jgi:hypothetical protein
MAKTGRKTRLTPALEHAIVTAIAGGAPYYQACLLAGVPASTATLWMERGEHRHPNRPATPQLVTFVAAVKKAEAQDEVRRLLRISQAGQGGVVVYERTITHPDGRVEREVRRTAPQWQCDAWVLERKFPDRWGKRMQVQADLQLKIREIAQEVADEIGVPVEDILKEAQAVLNDYDRRHGR